MKATHAIRVLGRELKVRSSASAETVREVEGYLNDRIAEVARSLPNADQQLVTLLTLLNVTESYLALRREGSGGDVRTDRMFEALAEKIDRALGDEIPRRVNI